MTKIKVLFDLHPYSTHSTGIGRYSFNLANSLNNYPDISLSVYTTSSTQPTAFTQFKFPLNNGLARLYLGLPQAISHFKPNILHFHYFPPRQFPSSLILVNTIHDLCFLSHPHHFNLKQRLMFRFFCLPYLHHSHAIIVPSQFVKNQLLQFTSYPTSKIFVIPEGIDPIFTPLSSTNSLLQISKSHHLPKSPFFLVVGNIEPRKNPQTIIRSFLPLLNHPQKPNLIFVGPLKQKKVFQPFSHLLNQRLFHFPYLPNQQLNLFYNATTALIYYSDCEGFGLPPLEAARTQTPVILKNTAISHETLPYALFASNQTEITQHLHNLLKIKPTRLIQQTYHHSLSYTWQKTAQLTYSLYQTLIQT